MARTRVVSRRASAASHAVSAVSATVSAAWRRYVQPRLTGDARTGSQQRASVARANPASCASVAYARSAERFAVGISNRRRGGSQYWRHYVRVRWLNERCGSISRQQAAQRRHKTQWWGVREWHAARQCENWGTLGRFRLEWPTGAGGMCTAAGRHTVRLLMSGEKWHSMSHTLECVSPGNGWWPRLQ